MMDESMDGRIDESIFCVASARYERFRPPVGVLYDDLDDELTLVLC